MLKSGSEVELIRKRFESVEIERQRMLRFESEVELVRKRFEAAAEELQQMLRSGAEIWKRRGSNGNDEIPIKGMSAVVVLFAETARRRQG